MSNSVKGADAYFQGKLFEREIEENIVCASNVWVMRIRDGGNNERPGDLIVLYNKFRLLVEAKSTCSSIFNVRALIKRHQIVSLRMFMLTYNLNIGLFFIKFIASNAVYAVDVESLMSYIKQTRSTAIQEHEFAETKLNCVCLSTDNNSIDHVKLSYYLELLYANNN